METELKLSLGKRHNAAFIRGMETLAAVMEGPADSRLRDVYFDTPDRDLARRDCGLRIRRRDGCYWQTLKLAQCAGGGLHAREEFEAEIAGPRLDPERIEHAPTRDWALMQGAALDAVFEVRLRRRRWLLDYASARIEVALDTGSIHAGERRAEINEIELELQAGPVDALFALAIELAQSLPLIPETGNKAALGYALLRGAGTPSPSAAQIPPLSPHISPSEAIAAMVREAMRHLLDNRRALEHGADPVECVHQARIALRRLRLAVAELNRIAPAEDQAEHAQALADCSLKLGAVRDLDVCMHETLPSLNGVDLCALHPELERQRVLAMRQARAALATPAFARLLLVLLRQLHRAALEAADRRLPLRDFVPRLLERHDRRVRRLACDWKQLSGQRRHELRKRVKKLRYLSEFFSGLYRARAVQRYLPLLQRLQQELGADNDAIIAGKLLTSLGRRRPALAAAVETTLRALREREADTRRPGQDKNVRLLARRDGFWKIRSARGHGKR
ncbi:CYTH and CHAD domain-containing protein [Paludibacterium yongneupense]|uniref:CYTH and CHAD domain-containing protein n=1 Tax=Paludibacterium yongneupense TaxID=400061 RepID=UPI000429EAAB|nr:CYTH and CHAD domain-containing protein [Paludibacterium yongneupense]